MCKHILFNNFDKKDIPMIHRFAELTHDRDGFGMIAKLKSGEIKTIKSCNLAGFYMELSKVITMQKVLDLVIHHRTSTNGSGVAYSHPFEYQGHYLTHNGVVTVPGKHETKTTNDSEALLHHLIKSDYETKTISGYFSCFILNKDETIVLVDATAPIYTDGRVYSSHNITGEWVKVEGKKITLKNGVVTDSKDIEITKTNYGMDKATLSLGWSDQWEYNFKKDYLMDNVDSFMSLLRYSDESWIASQRSIGESYRCIRELASEYGLKLKKKEIRAIYKLIAIELVS